MKKRVISLFIVLAVIFSCSIPAYAADGDSGSGLGGYSAEQIYAKCSPAIFYISTFDENKEYLGSGSGFFIDSSGVAVTCYHVIDGVSYAKISVGDAVYEVTDVYDYDVVLDLAIIKVNGNGFSTLSLGDSSRIRCGQNIFAIGSPLGLKNSISEGIISNTDLVINGNELIQYTAPISHGSSGGALINKEGQVIGITSGGLASGQNINLASPINKVKSLKSESVRTFDQLIKEREELARNILKVSSSAVSVTTGMAACLTVTNYSATDTLSVYADSPEIVSVYWGNKIDDNSRQLYVKGFSPGKTTVVVTYRSNSQYSGVYQDIEVTVTGEVLKYNTYREFPDVPDLGTYLGAVEISKYFELPAEDGMDYKGAYFYDPYIIYSTNETFNRIMSDYESLLYLQGFNYNRTNENYDGYYVYVYENYDDNISVSLGLTKINGAVYFQVLIYNTY